MSFPLRCSAFAAMKAAAGANWTPQYIAKMASDLLQAVESVIGRIQ